METLGEDGQYAMVYDEWKPMRALEVRVMEPKQQRDVWAAVGRYHKAKRAYGRKPSVMRLRKMLALRAAAHRKHKGRAFVAEQEVVIRAIRQVAGIVVAASGKYRPDPLDSGSNGGTMTTAAGAAEETP